MHFHRASLLSAPSFFCIYIDLDSIDGSEKPNSNRNGRTKIYMLALVQTHMCFLFTGEESACIYFQFMVYNDHMSSSKRTKHNRSNSYHRFSNFTQ